MKIINKLILIGVFSVGMVGCNSTHSNITSTESFTQLGKEEILSLYVGNTKSSKLKWGTWTEYYVDDSTSIAKARGDFGEENVTSMYSVSESGEVCSIYAGDADWARKDYEYCGQVYVDINNTYFIKQTKNPSKPEKVGNIFKIQISSGNQYDLTE